MDDRAPLDRVLRIAQHLASLTNPEDILAAASREMLAWAGGRSAFATCCIPGHGWERGIQLEIQPDRVAVAGSAARSALFAIHRKLAMAPAPIALATIDEPAICAGLRADTLYAVPLLQRSRAWGELVVTEPRQIESGAIGFTEIARFTSIALQNVHRLAFARRDQDRLLLLAEATDDALYDHDIDSRDFWWGGGVLRLFGSDSDPVENSWRWKQDHVHPDDRERVHASFEAARASKTMRWNAEYRFRRHDGSYIAVEDRSYLLRDANGRAYRVIGSMRDVTAMKDLLAREQEARAEAEKASRAKDDFLAMLGHELRNPLAPIVTGLELLRLRGSIDVERDLPVLQRQAQHLIRLVDDLLDISRIANGKVELKKERLDIATVVDAAVETASPLIDGRGHVLEVDVPRGLEVIGDRARLAQALANLLTNAAKYTEPGGRIEVVARPTPQNRVELAIRDTGIGIAPQILPHVFAMFVQERQALDRSQGGLGLGLSIVRSLVELHGGAVSARSAGRGQGSTFTIELPAAHEMVQPNPRPSKTKLRATPSGRKIVVVDDNEDAAELLAALLEQLGNTTRVAHDARHAMAVIEEFQPDVAVLDIGLPEIDGYELARRLRDRIRWPLHLIALTGYGQQSDKERAKEAGFDAHLVKPVGLDKLHAVIVALPATDSYRATGSSAP